MVIGLNLCPFARRVFQAQTIRYMVSEARDGPALRQDLTSELKTLASSPLSAIETTLLIHPHALVSFSDYNQFLGDGEELARELRVRGAIQIAGFHPEYQFEGTDPEAAENYTNRSPYPMFHLLREASFSGLAPEEELLEIPQRNIATMRALGTARILQMLKSIRAE